MANALKSAHSADAPANPIFISVAEAARITAQSEWTVWDHLRNGRYRARKAGRRTLIEYSSIKQDADNLPVATFAAPRRRRRA
jgi:hypothetical protein